MPEILTFPVLFHAGTWQSVGTTASIVSTVSPMRDCESALGSCQGGLWPGCGHVQANPMQRVTGVSGAGLDLLPHWWESSLQKCKP